MRVLLQVGHEGIEQITAAGLCPGRDAVALSHSTGANGERAWNRAVADALAPLLRARGAEVVVVGAVYFPDVYGQDWDLILAIHAQRDAPTHRAFASAPNPAGGYIGPAAQQVSERWAAAFNQPTGAVVVPATPQFISANMTDYYAWCYATLKSPCVIVETKNLDIDALATADQVATFLRDVTATVLPQSTPMPPPAPAPGPVLLAALGPTRVTRQRAIGALWSQNALGSIEVVDLYLALAPLANIPAEVVIAQMLKETNYLRFGGTDPVFSATPDMHNYCGLKTADGSATARFPTPEAGVRAHLGHWLVYFGDHFPPFCGFDPRHDLAGHRHYADNVAQLSGHWAPSPTYADSIIALALAMIG